MSPVTDINYFPNNNSSGLNSLVKSHLLLERTEEQSTHFHNVNSRENAEMLRTRLEESKTARERASKRARARERERIAGQITDLLGWGWKLSAFRKSNEIIMNVKAIKIPVPGPSICSCSSALSSKTSQRELFFSMRKIWQEVEWLICQATSCVMIYSRCFHPYQSSLDNLVVPSEASCHPPGHNQ